VLLILIDDAGYGSNSVRQAWRQETSARASMM
jgi:hypothetical protein